MQALPQAKKQIIYEDQSSEEEKIESEDEENKDPYDQSAIGIDLGTTYSGVAKVSKGMTDNIDGVKCDMLPDEDGCLVIPSVVFCPSSKGHETRK